MYMIVNFMKTFLLGWFISSLLGKMKLILKNLMEFLITTMSFISSTIIRINITENLLRKCETSVYNLKQICGYFLKTVSSLNGNDIRISSWSFILLISPSIVFTFSIWLVYVHGLHILRKPSNYVPTLFQNVNKICKVLNFETNNFLLSWNEPCETWIENKWRVKTK